MEVPLYGVALMFLFLGVLAGGIAAWLNGVRARGENRRLRRRLTGLETQVDVLKRQLAEAEDRRVAAAAAANTPDGVPPAVELQFIEPLFTGRQRISPQQQHWIDEPRRALRLCC